MSDIAIKVENRSKHYRIGRKAARPDTFGGTVVDRLRRPWQNLQQLRQLARFAQTGQEAKRR